MASCHFANPCRGTEGTLIPPLPCQDRSIVSEQAAYTAPAGPKKLALFITNFITTAIFLSASIMISGTYQLANSGGPRIQLASMPQLAEERIRRPTITKTK